VKPSALHYALHGFVDGHLVELVDLWVAAWTKAMPAIGFEARRVWFVDHFQLLRDSGVAVTCAFDERNGEMAGFITFDPESGHIDQLAVAPKHWGSPAAGKLLIDAMTRAPGILRLEVNQDNPRAVRFYEKHGFHRRAAGINPNSGLRTWHYEWTRR